MSFLVFSNEINITTRVLSPTEIQVNWSLVNVSHSGDITGITVFYKTLDAGPSFHANSVPTTVNGTTVLKNLKKFTEYKITVSATTVNGTGVPSKFSEGKTHESGKLCSLKVLFTQMNQLNNQTNVSYRVYR